MNKATREAKAAIRDIEAELAAHEAKKNAEALAEQRAAKQLDKLRGPATVQRKDAPVEETDMVRVRPGYIGNLERDKLTAAIEGGSIKVEWNGSVQRGAKSLADILRVPDPVDVRALARLDRRIQGLQTERRALIEAMHGRGRKLTVRELAEHATKVYNATANIRIRYGGGDDWERRRIEDRLTVAHQHLAYLEGRAKGITLTEGGPEVCPCRNCGIAEQERQKRERELARINALPKITALCPLHEKNERVPVDRRRVNIPPELAEKYDLPPTTIEDFPVGYCAKEGKWFYLATLWKSEAPKRERAERRLLKAEGVHWTCPDCEVVHTTIPALDDYYGAVVVQCPAEDEGAVFPLAEINPKAYAKWRAKHEEDAA